MENLTVKQICGFQDSKGNFHRTEQEAIDSNYKISVDKLLRELYDKYQYSLRGIYYHEYTSFMRDVLENPEPFNDALVMINSLKASPRIKEEVKNNMSYLSRTFNKIWRT